jgi:hypothetical protein
MPVRVIAIALLVGLAGCVPTVSGNARFAVVYDVWGPNEALSLAESHCGYYGRVARFRYMGGMRAIFQCDPIITTSNGRTGP